MIATAGITLSANFPLLSNTGIFPEEVPVFNAAAVPKVGLCKISATPLEASQSELTCAAGIDKVTLPLALGEILLTDFTVPAFLVNPQPDTVVSVTSAGIEIVTFPLELGEMLLTDLTVPTFFVKPQPETVVSVTSAGILGLFLIKASSSESVSFQSA